MDEWRSIDAILEFAIANEAAAVEFYSELADRADSPIIKQTLESFAREERGHKSKLERIKKQGSLKLPRGKALELKVGDYLVEAEASPDMNMERALLVAMEREKAAYKLYRDLALQADDAEVRDAFLRLAHEEAKHKLEFEVGYDELLSETQL